MTLRSIPSQIGHLADVDTTTTAPSTDDALLWNGTHWVPGEVSGTGSSGGASSSVDEDRLYAVAVTLMRPSKVKLKIGSFGTWVPSERVYARTLNLVRLGASTNNYMSGHRAYDSEFNGTPLTPSDSVTAHGSLSIVVYVTETDVAAVQNPKATYFRMRADLARSVAVSHHQAEITASPKTGSSITTITPGANGSMVLDFEGQGYELDLVATIGGTNYNAAQLATKNAMTADGTANEWGHSWFGRVPLMFPIDDSMDGNTVTWGVQAYSAQVNYAGFVNARVAALPADWDTDEAGDGSSASGRWEVVVTGNPAEAVTTPDGTDWLYVLVDD